MMELNREQIIKALECCSNNDECVGEACPYYATGCEKNMPKDALSLINELTEENKAWQMQLISQEEKASKAYYDLACEVEDLRAIAEQYQKQFEDARADTLSELKNRLTREVGTYLGISIMKVSDMFKLIDQITKEMLEGTQNA